MHLLMKQSNDLVSERVKDTTIGAESKGFDSRACNIGHSVVDGSPPLRFFGAALPTR